MLFSARGLLGEVINVLWLDQGSPLLDVGLGDLLPVVNLGSGLCSVRSLSMHTCSDRA